MKHVVLSRAWELHNSQPLTYRIKLRWQSERRHDILLLEGVTPSITTADLDMPTLPEGGFSVLRTKGEEKILILGPGSDSSSRCLLFVGVGGYSHDTIKINKETTATLLQECRLISDIRVSVEAVALLEMGQRIVFSRSASSVFQVYLYTWDGKEIRQKMFSSEAEWERHQEVEALLSRVSRDADVL